MTEMTEMTEKLSTSFVVLDDARNGGKTTQSIGSLIHSLSGSSKSFYP